MFDLETKDNNRIISTTIGLLNFFKWAIENKILDNIEKNRSFLEKEMNNPMKGSSNIHTPRDMIKPSEIDAHKIQHMQNNQGNAVRKKRTASSIKNMTMFEGSAMISFE